MATTARKMLVYGNHRVTFLVLIDQGEGDLEELQLREGPPLIDGPSPIKEAPILIEKIETQVNVGMPEEPHYNEIGEFADLGQLFSNLQELKLQKTALEQNNQQLSRQLGVLESQQQA